MSVFILIQFLLILLVGIVVPSTATSKRERPVAVGLERPRFAVEAGAFWTDGIPYVAVEVAIPYRELMFRLDGDTYQADFDLIVVLYKGKRQITGDLWEISLTPDSYSETRGSSKHHHRGVVLKARPGKLRVEVTVSERASGNEGRLVQEIEVPEIEKERLLIGRIWFGECVADSIDRLRPVPPQPLTLRRFGEAVGEVCAWSRIYGSDLRPGERIELDWLVRDDRRDQVAEGRLDLTAQEERTPIYLRLPTESLWLGGYELVLRAKVGEQEAERIIGFEMDETTVSLDLNPNESIELVRYIATGEEIKELENAPPEERLRVWKEFWQERDPTPETEENEFKGEFFRRVRYSNDQFGGIGPGWKTDRGMIYIQYGEPDQVESYPHNVDGPPHEVWIYNSLRRRFVFVDYDGFGRYELHTPGR